jgi:hypothetical protein
MINEKMMIQSCINHCQNSHSDIRNMASSITNPGARDELNKASGSIEACIKQCQAALNKV